MTKYWLEANHNLKYCLKETKKLRKNLLLLFSSEDHLFLIPLSHFTLQIFVRDFTLIASFVHKEVKCAKRQEL